MEPTYNIELFSFFSEFSNRPLPDDFMEQIENRFEIDFTTSLGTTALPHPLILGLSEKELLFPNIEKSFKSGFSGLSFLISHQMEKENFSGLKKLLTATKEHFPGFPLIGALKLSLEENNLEPFVQKVSEVSTFGLDFLQVILTTENPSQKFHLEIIQTLSYLENKKILIGFEENLLDEKLFETLSDWKGKFEGVMFTSGEKFKNESVLMLQKSGKVLPCGVSSKFDSGLEIFGFLNSGFQFAICEFHKDYEPLVPQNSNNPYQDFFHHLFLNPENGLVQSYL